MQTPTIGPATAAEESTGMLGLQVMDKLYTIQTLDFNQQGSVWVYKYNALSEQTSDDQSFELLTSYKKYVSTLGLLDPLRWIMILVSGGDFPPLYI